MKKTLLRCLVGAPIGLAISTLITIAASLSINDGIYYPVVPELTADFGSEMNAVLIQAIFSLIYGAVFGGASVIWEKDWSVAKMTITHFIIISLVTLPIAYSMRWMRHSIIGVLIYFGIFAAIYITIWLSQYCAIKKKIDAINKQVKK